jgi:hypothetical protein
MAPTVARCSIFIEHQEPGMLAPLMSALSTLVGRAVRGAVAGVVGTLALDLVNYRRARQKGSDEPFAQWEIVRDLKSWDDAPAPGRVGRKILATVTGEDPPVQQAAAASNVMHWLYGIGWGKVYAVACPRRPWFAGPLFGAAVWSSDYVTLPLLGIYEPIWKYDLPTLWDDLLPHLAFGTATDLTARLLRV